MDKKESISLRFLLIIGLLIFFYPNISDYINSVNKTNGIVHYDKALSEFENIDIEKIRKDAISYNKKIYEEKSSIIHPNLVKGYDKKLNPFNDGMMGYLNIEKIGVSLPIYHGINEGVIQGNIGHLPGTSLPIGGKSSHAVLTTHSGLAFARLFTDLNKLKIGDEFVLSILGKNMYYRVIKIETVNPKNIKSLKVYEGKDYITLFTCTPYGINTHRLLVRGERFYKEDIADNEDVQVNVKKNMYSSLFKLITIIALVIVIFLSIVKDIISLKKRSN